jgi:DNA processing protein
MNVSLRHWLQLSLTEGIGPILVQRIVAVAGGAEPACAVDAGFLRQIDGIGPDKSRGIGRSLREAATLVDQELDRCNSAGVSLICPDDALYPTLLRNIPDPPTVLFMRGSLEPRDLNSIAIVGSRRCSLYGREQAERFGSLLAGAAFTVISGGARGIDSAAHRGAMAQPQGRTIAVCGSGLDVPYPPENVSLFTQIAERGAVLSEFTLGTPPTKENFPRRNRIVSGLSRGVLVIEADERSGALITARLACDDHGRPVFALPGRVDNPLSQGPHKLIRDGAALATKLEDIVDGLGPLPDNAVYEPPVIAEVEAPNSVAPSALQPEFSFDDSSDRQRLILSHMESQPLGVDMLVESTGLPAHIILQELTFLTLKGRVRRGDGQTFARRT